ncbi:MAG: hypothetical protein M3R27_16385, partial [Bacteroidota bacterium]|nr:hypothetical protein [Bacteroidota bacterium]
LLIMSTEQAYKSFSSWISSLLNTCISVLKVMLRSKTGIRLPSATTDTCIVLGNGPSLKTSLQKHPDLFKNHPLVCVNSFSVTDEYILLKPGYYVMLDPGFWFGDNSELVNSTLESIISKTTWPLELIVPQLAAKSALITEISKKNPNIHVTFFNYTVFKGFQNIAYSFYRKNLAAPQSQNVLVAAIFCSINIGFKKILLFGADHTWHEQLHVNDENVLCLKNIHFYENESSISHKPFYKGVHSKETFRVDEIFVTWGKTFYGYVALNDYAISENCEILNASEISFIDAFKRVKL